MMRGYLLDTDAISMLAPRPDRKETVSPALAAFQAWVREHNDELFLSAVALAEVQAGISKLERKGATRRAANLSVWLAAILRFYEARTHDLTLAVALETGRLLDRAIGVDPGFEDAAIAATAIVHDLTVVTADTRHFQTFGVALMAPPLSIDVGVSEPPTDRN